MTHPIRQYARRGKEFEELLEREWEKSQDGVVQREISIELDTGKKGRKGRIDILIEDEEMALVLEVKSTDWDKVKRSRLREYALRHIRQLYRYVDAVIEKTGKAVCPGITYPEKPRQGDREKELLEIFEERCASISFEKD